MRDFFKSFRFKIFIAFLAFLIGIMIYAVTKGGYAVSGASFINTVTQPFKKFQTISPLKLKHVSTKCQTLMTTTTKTNALKNK